MQAQEILSLIPWLTVPTITCALLIYSRKIVSDAVEPELRTSASAGFWAGMVLFVAYIAANLGTVTQPVFRFSSVPRADIPSMIVGVAVGAGILATMTFIASSRMIGLVTLVLSATSMSILYGFIFVEGARSTLLFFSLGTALGCLVYIVFVPRSVRRR